MRHWCAAALGETLPWRGPLSCLRRKDSCGWDPEGMVPEEMVSIQIKKGRSPNGERPFCRQRT